MISRKELHKAQSASILIAMVYIELFTHLTQKYDSHAVEVKLRTMGVNIAKSYYEYYIPSKSTISGTIKELAEKLAGMKHIRLQKTEDGFTYTSSTCPLCQPNIEIEGPKFCIPVCVILETFLNLIFTNFPWKFPYTEAIGTVTKSISSGDDVCEYHFRLLQR
ncbi:MAG: hypothetical protein LUQ65_05180 [Candidatus Helarchaeota archaeon]|nr:hypothetical protein [Candidatus Helarchaeota archaeon]